MRYLTAQNMFLSLMGNPQGQGREDLKQIFKASPFGVFFAFMDKLGV